MEVAPHRAFLAHTRDHDLIRRDRRFFQKLAGSYASIGISAIA